MLSKNSNIKAIETTIKSQYYQRVNHRAIKIGKQWFIFGGVNQKGKQMSKVLKINSQTYDTEDVLTQNQLTLDGFAIFSYQQQVYLYGLDQKNEITNGLWVFEGSKFTSVVQNGNIPSPRSYFASSFILNRYLLIYGGSNQLIFYYDWFLLDCQTMNWKKLSVDLSIPKSLSHAIDWCENIGFLVIYTGYQKSSTKIVYSQLFFHLEFENSIISENSLKVIKIGSAEGQNKSVQKIEEPVSRNSPFLKFINRNNLLFMGGQTLQTRVFDWNVFHDCWLLNTKSFKWKKLSFQIKAAFHFDAIFNESKLVIIGGQQSVEQLSSVIQSIDLESIVKQQSNSCKTICNNCLKLETTNTQNVNKGCTYSPTKYQQLKLDKNVKNLFKQKKNSIQQAQYFPGYLIWQMGNQIQSPVSALALLVDNSFNVSANYVQISLKKINNSNILPSSKPEHFQQKLIKPRLGFSHGFIDFQEDVYKLGRQNKINNYLIYQDNSSAFTLQEAEQIIYKLDWKRGISSIDAKIDEQQSIWKQYGVNLKLAAMKLGSSFLFITKTFNTQEVFISFVSYKQIGQNPYTNKPVCCLSYVISEKGKVYDQAIRDLICKKVKQFSGLQHFEETKDFTTKIYIFNLAEGTTQALQNGFQIGKNSLNTLNCTITPQIQKTLINYSNKDQFQRYQFFLKHQYLKPYFGRGVRIQGTKVLFQDHIQKFHCDQIRGSIHAIIIGTDEQFFKQIGLYYYFCDKSLGVAGNRHLSPSSTPIAYSNSLISLNNNCYSPYDLPYVLIYHQNRLIAVKQYKNPILCGYIQIPDQIQINIFKNRILKLRDSKKLDSFLNRKHRQLYQKKTGQSQKIIFNLNQHQISYKSNFRIQDKQDVLETNFKHEQCLRKRTKFNHQ